MYGAKTCSTKKRKTVTTSRSGRGKNSPPLNMQRALLGRLFYTHNLSHRLKPSIYSHLHDPCANVLSNACKGGVHKRAYMQSIGNICLKLNCPLNHALDNAHDVCYGKDRYE